MPPSTSGRPPRVVIAPDSFKGSLDAREAAQAIAAGVLDAVPGADVVLCPMADGGEGTLAALIPPGHLHQTRVSGPLGDPVLANWGLRDDGTAVIEVAAAVGLPLVPEAQRDPERATSRGVGELLLAARHEGAVRVLVGLGGSGTVDGGIGMLAVLGAVLTDAQRRPLAPVPTSLAAAAHLDLAPALAAVAGLELTALSDVRSPLLGPEGARRFMAQKGADEAAQGRLEAGLARLAQLGGRPELSVLPGAGAAGGLGFGLALLGADLAPGAPVVAAAVGLEQALAGATLVLTGEGRFDAQSGAGKGPGYVLQRAAEAGARAVVLCGQADPEPAPGGPVRVLGPDLSVAERLARPRELLREAACQVVLEALPPQC